MWNPVSWARRDREDRETRYGANIEVFSAKLAPGVLCGAGIFFRFFFFDQDATGPVVDLYSKGPLVTLSDAY